MRVLFISHGGPGSMLQRQDKETIAYWTNVGNQYQREGIKGIVCVSAHWFGHNSIEINTLDSIIYDFGDFYHGIYDEKYSFVVPSDDIVDSLVGKISKSGMAAKARQRGIDHGIWIPFKFMFPNGDMPILEVQLPTSNDFNVYVSLGRTLRNFADQHGYAIIASGGITHNLNDAFTRMRKGLLNSAPDQTSVGFLKQINELLASKPTLSGSEMMDVVQSWPIFSKNHPTLDHFLPLLVAQGARKSGVEMENDYWSFGMSLAAFKFE